MSTSRQQSSQACAACKHQRRKCYPDCVMARYFPAERAQQFLDVHRLFGISNVMKMYNNVTPELRDAAVEAMTYEAEMRREDPVHGCLGVVRELSAKIEATKKELEATRQNIQFHKKQEHEMRMLQAGQQQQLLLPPTMKQAQVGRFPLQPPRPVLVNPIRENMESEASGHLPSLKIEEDVIPFINRAHLAIQTDNQSTQM